MKVESFIKKYRVNKLYAYHEKSTDKRTVSFGWVDSKSLDLNNPVVLSSSSKAKSVSDDDRNWGKSEGNSAASLADYKKYFEALTGSDAGSFYDEWKDKEDQLEEMRSASNKHYRDGEGSFLISLANLIANNEKFTKFGRIYKIIDLKT